MARMTVASGSRAASRDALGCVFQHNTESCPKSSQYTLILVAHWRSLAHT